MAWLRLDDQFDQHPKVELLTDREFRVHVRVLCYCARYKTEGAVPLSVFTAVRGLTLRVKDRFLALGLWDERDGNLFVHNFEKYNPRDPTKAARQARWRENRNAPVDTRVDGDVDTRVDAPVDGGVDGGVDTPHARARARVPSPTPLTPPNPPRPGGLDQEEQTRLDAWRTHAHQRADIREPEAYAQTMFVKGGWPNGTEPEHRFDVTTACRNWITGHGWDETYDEAMVVEELERLAHKAGDWEIPERATLLAEWQAEQQKRYPEVAA